MDGTYFGYRIPFPVLDEKKKSGEVIFFFVHPP